MPAKVGFVYASQTGNAEAICKGLYSKAVSGGLVDRESRCLTMNQWVEAGFVGFSTIVVIAATTGDGAPPDNARRCWRHLQKAEKGCLKDIKFAVLCLGDQNYEDFCGFGIRVDVSLGELGGTRFMERGEADDGVGLEVVVEPFTRKLLETLPGVETMTESVSYIHTAAAAVPIGRDTRTSNKRCFITSIKDGKMPDYLKHASTIPTKVIKALRGYGVTNATYFRVPTTNQIVMTLTLSSHLVDYEKVFGAGSEYLADPDCAVWEASQAEYHTGWTACDEFHSSDFEWDKKLLGV